MGNMKIIISPAKKMNISETMEWKELPVFLREAEEISAYMRSLSYEEAKKLWKCNDKIARLNYERFQMMDLRRNLSPAILSYEGLQYQYMAPEVLDEEALDYLQGHLRILSGFYGVLRPFDGIVPYRLEMQARAAVGGSRDLYGFWGDRLYRELVSGGTEVIVDLASREYSKAVSPGQGDPVRMIAVTFGEEKDGKVVQKGTMAKMARGEMVRFMAENRMTDPEEIKSFERLQYRFSEKHSTEDSYVFLRKPDE